MRKRNEWGKLNVFQKANCQKQLTVLWLYILRDSGEFVANWREWMIYGYTTQYV